MKKSLPNPIQVRKITFTKGSKVRTINLTRPNPRTGSPLGRRIV